MSFGDIKKKRVVSGEADQVSSGKSGGGWSSGQSAGVLLVVVLLVVDWSEVFFKLLCVGAIVVISLFFVFVDPDSGIPFVVVRGIVLLAGGLCAGLFVVAVLVGGRVFKVRRIKVRAV